MGIGFVVGVLGVLLLSHAAYSTVLYRALLKITEEDFSGPPIAVIGELLSGLILCMWAALTVPGKFLSILPDSDENSGTNASFLLAICKYCDKLFGHSQYPCPPWWIFCKYSLLLKKEKAIIVQPDRVTIANGPTPDRVTIANGPTFGCILMKDFLKALAKRLKCNTTAYENYHGIYVPEEHPLKCEPNEPLRVDVLFQHIQNMLSSESAVIAETGDSWFNFQKLKLPQGCGYEFQMQYGSIGWSVGATLGYAQAAQDKRVIACIGDGSFQVTAQDVSTMLRCGQKTIIFLMNNGGYTIEVEIHDGPYNVIKNWNYTGLVDAIHNAGQLRSVTKRKIEAIETATGAKKDCLCFIEVIAQKDDTSKELLKWGSRVSAANSRPPNPQ